MTYHPFDYLSELQRGEFHTCRQAAMLSVRHLQVSCGRRLVVLSAGNPQLPSVVLVNPLGVSCLFFMNIAEALVGEYRVVTWETLDDPQREETRTADDEQWSPEAHGRDLLTVLDECNAREPRALISYCSGSYLALYALARGLVGSPKRLVLISPPLELDADGARTLYQRTFPPLLSRIAQSGPRMAGVVRQIMLQAGSREAQDIDRELDILNSLPFASNASTYRYACLHAAWRTLPWSKILSEVATPSVVLHGTTDDVVHMDCVRALVAAMPHAQLRSYEGEGHYAVYQCTELVRDAVALAQG